MFITIQCAPVLRYHAEAWERIQELHAAIEAANAAENPAAGSTEEKLQKI